MTLLLSSHKRSDVRGEQNMLSRLKKRAKINVSNFAPGDEYVTQMVELRRTRGV